MGQLEAIWLKRMKGGPMDPVERATLKAHQGLVGNTNQGGKRQVTLLEQEVWQALMEQFGASLDPSARRANLLLSGVRLANSRKRVLQIGNCRIRIWGETKPCEHLEEACPGLKEAMADNWMGGAFGEILDDGEIFVGDPVRWLE
jgi:MOSC domain-containing protein YiiM